MTCVLAATSVMVIHAAVAADPAAVSRFEHESRAVSLINHPNILGLYDVVRPDGRNSVVWLSRAFSDLYLADTAR